MKRTPWAKIALFAGSMLIISGVLMYWSSTSFEDWGMNLMKNLSQPKTLTTLRTMFDRNYNFTQLYQWEHTKVEFAKSNEKFNRSEDPLEILANGKGLCGEFSILYVALCLAHGYQSRLVFSVDETYQVIWLSLHSWAEIKLGNNWVHVDPSDQVWNSTSHYQGWWSGLIIRIYAFENEKVTDVTARYHF